MPDFSFSPLEGAVTGVTTALSKVDDYSDTENSREGLVLDLDARRIILGNVAQWSDTSGITTANDFNMTNATKEIFQHIPVVNFNGTNTVGTAVSVSDSLNITTGSFTIESLVYTVGNTPTGNVNTIISQEDNNINPLNYSLGIKDSDTKPIFRYQTTNSLSSRQNLTSSTSISHNTWNHIAVTYNGQVIRLYVNGIETANVTTSIFSTNQQTNIGLDLSNTKAFNGKIAYIRVYERSLSTNELVNSSKFAYITNTNGTISAGTIDLGVSSSVPGVLTGRRPSIGLLFPRGVYNK
jgi:hypothetical protein